MSAIEGIIAIIAQDKAMMPGNSYLRKITRCLIGRLG